MEKTIKKYYKEIQDGLIVQHMQTNHAGQLEELQKIVFPTLADDELIRAAHYLRHLEVFPEGQFVITDGDRVIGMTTTMRTDFDFLNYHHTFKETIGGGWLTNHNPEGEWLYGLDMGLLPSYRGKGLARVLYRARHEIAKALELKGQLTVGMMSGYGSVSKEMDGETYYQQLIAGKRKDPTITPQMKIGFEPIALMPDHLNDPVCGNFGILIKLSIDKTV
jgi:GNAT superfamily N-acetyltransferase